MLDVLLLLLLLSQIVIVLKMNPLASYVFEISFPERFTLGEKSAIIIFKEVGRLGGPHGRP
jgi:hypothetical protein